VIKDEKVVCVCVISVKMYVPTTFHSPLTVALTWLSSYMVAS